MGSSFQDNSKDTYTDLSDIFEGCSVLGGNGNAQNTRWPLYLVEKECPAPQSQSIPDRLIPLATPLSSRWTLPLTRHCTGMQLKKATTTIEKFSEAYISGSRYGKRSLKPVPNTPFNELKYKFFTCFNKISVADPDPHHFAGSGFAPKPMDPDPDPDHTKLRKDVLQMN